MCQQFSNVNNRNESKQQPHHRPSGRWPTTNRIEMPIRQRTLSPIQWNVISLLFIVLLSINGQSQFVFGARSRDNFNSIYLNNNHSVNNQNGRDTDPAAETNAISYDDLEIIDIDDLTVTDPYLQNVTDGSVDDSRTAYSSSRKLRRSPIYHNEFAVYVPYGANEADAVANRHGFTNAGQVSF